MQSGRLSLNQVVFLLLQLLSRWRDPRHGVTASESFPDMSRRVSEATNIKPNSEPYWVALSRTTKREVCTQCRAPGRHTILVIAGGSVGSTWLGQLLHAKPCIESFIPT